MRRETLKTNKTVVAELELEAPFSAKHSWGTSPAQLVVSLVIAISLWSRDSRDVLFLIIPPFTGG